MLAVFKGISVYKTCSKGFTLIELTLAVMLLALLTAFSIPSFQSLYRRSEMQKIASEFNNVLRYAQQRAVMERIPVRVVIDVRENTYWVPVEEEAQGRRHYRSRSHRARDTRASRRSSRRVKEVQELRGKLPKGFIFEFVYKVATDDEYKRGEAEFYFYPDGSADAGYFTVLRLAETEDEESRLFIRISPATGVISSMEGLTNEDGSDFYRGYYDNLQYAS
ncbi:MAG: pilus assembly FimT family protein [bacterium]